MHFGTLIRAQYLPLLSPVQQSGAAVEHNDVILTLGLHINGHVVHTPISHVSLDLGIGSLHKLRLYLGVGRWSAKCYIYHSKSAKYGDVRGQKMQTLFVKAP